MEDIHAAFPHGRTQLEIPNDSRAPSAHHLTQASLVRETPWCPARPIQHLQLGNLALALRTEVVGPKNIQGELVENLPSSTFAMVSIVHQIWHPWNLTLWETPT